MKTLSIKQPYASLIAEGLKDIENRTQRTNYRGTVLIHASAKHHDRVKDSIVHGPLYTKAQRALVMEKKDAIIVSPWSSEVCPRSAIIGQVDIIDCIQDSMSIWAEPGAWHWVLENAILYDKPILNVKGQLGIWNFHDNIFNLFKNEK